MSPENISRILENVQSHQAFWCRDGKVFSNLHELQQALHVMTPEVYSHHVTGDKNDFSNWIGEIMKDSTLARSIAKVKSPKVAAKKISARIQDIEELAKLSS